MMISYWDVERYAEQEEGEDKVSSKSRPPRPKTANLRILVIPISGLWRVPYILKDPFNLHVDHSTVNQHYDSSQEAKLANA